MLTARAAVPEGPEAQVDIFTNMTSAFCVSPSSGSSFIFNRVLVAREECMRYVRSVHTERVAKCRAPIDTRLYQREDQCMCERRS